MAHKKKDEHEEVDYKTKAGTAWSHNYLNQKPWHPLSYPNMRRKWIAEQMDNENAKKQANIDKEFAKEQDFFKSTAMLDKKHKKKVEAMASVSFMYTRPPGYNPESAHAAKLADEQRQAGGGAADELPGGAPGKGGEANGSAIVHASEQPPPPDAMAAVRGLGAPPPPEEARRKRRVKDVFGRTVATAEEFPQLKNAPRVETGVVGRVKPFGIEVRNVKCARCGAFGHQSGDRECPMRDAITEHEVARQQREDPLSVMMANEPIKWKLKQQYGGTPPRGGFRPDDPNQQILAADEDELRADLDADEDDGVVDEYGGFLKEEQVARAEGGAGGDFAVIELARERLKTHLRKEAKREKREEKRRRKEEERRKKGRRRHSGEEAGTWNSKRSGPAANESNSSEGLGGGRGHRSRRKERNQKKQKQEGEERKQRGGGRGCERSGKGDQDDVDTSGGSDSSTYEGKSRSVGGHGRGDGEGVRDAHRRSGARRKRSRSRSEGRSRSLRRRRRGASVGPGEGQARDRCQGRNGREQEETSGSEGPGEREGQGQGRRQERSGRMREKRSASTGHDHGSDSDGSGDSSRGGRGRRLRGGCGDQAECRRRGPRRRRGKMEDGSAGSEEERTGKRGREWSGGGEGERGVESAGMPRDDASGELDRPLHASVMASGREGLTEAPLTEERHKVEAGGRRR